MFRRNTRDETILPGTKPFSTLRADVPKRWLINSLLNEAPPQAVHRELVMQNVVAINAAARQGIIAAQATTDGMLLESIADGGRNAMHILYSRHHVRAYRFILRIVRDASMAEDLTSQVFLDVWRTATQCEGRSGSPGRGDGNRGCASRC